MRALLLGFLALALSTCAPALGLEGASCPCVTGWTCCESASVCVRDGASCPTVPGPVVTETSIELGQDRIYRFSSTTDGVTWAVEEGAAGGTVDQSGRYRAPWAVGEYHLLARANGGTTRITITVRPLRVSVLSGTPGGTSRIPVDGIEQNARLARPKNLEVLGDSLYFFDDDSFRRLRISTKEVTTIFGKHDRTVGYAGDRSLRSLSRGGLASLLFLDRVCAREYFPATDRLDTFWCDERVFALTGDELRLVRAIYPDRLVMVERSTRREVELPGPPGGWTNITAVALFGSTLWVLANGGASLTAVDLDQPAAQPITVIAPTAGKTFIDLSADPEPFTTEANVTVLTAAGRVEVYDLLGRRQREYILSPSTLAFTAAMPAGHYALTADTIRWISFAHELLAGKPRSEPIEVDGIGEGARILMPEGLHDRGPAFAIRDDAIFLGAPLRIRRIGRDGTTTSISTNQTTPLGLAANSRHLYMLDAFDRRLRRMPLSGGEWQPLTFAPSAYDFTLLGALDDDRIVFAQAGELGFLDPSTGEALPQSLPFPRMSIVSLDPAGALYGEMGLGSSESTAGGQRFDFATGRLTKVGPARITRQLTPSQTIVETNLAFADMERQYAISKEGDAVLRNDGDQWVPFVGKVGAPVVSTGLLPGRVNTIKATGTLSNGDVVLFDTRENVVLVVE